MRLTHFTVIGGLVIGAIAGGLAIYLNLSGQATNSLERRVYDDATTSLSESRAISASVLSIKIDVIQVQQFLTDVSATRGLDGLDDGFAKARDFADRFENDTSNAVGLAQAAGLDNLTATLDQVKGSFMPYYATGQDMAHAYVAGGPEAGNPMMPEFDAAAEQMSRSLDALDAETARLDRAVQAKVAAGRATVEAMKWQQSIVQSITYAILVLCIGLMTAFYAGYALRRLRAMSRTMTAIASGDFSKPVYGSSVWEELKEIARSADVFRDNGIRLAALAAEEEARAAQVAADRAAVMKELADAFGSVVDSAVAGNFDSRVKTSFQDHELNGLARSVNTLVETVHAGLHETEEVLSAIARTDLTRRMRGSYEGAFARLRDDVNAVADNLADIVGQLRTTSNGVKLATGEILAGANDLSDRTTKQAATIEETSAAMEQLSSTVAANAENANAARRQAVIAANAAEDGVAVMHRATEAMERISTSSTRISNIIGLIDDIAFQTNLLALNASVEAARAGEAGKGFAVVAVEVRRLAQSAANASAEVKVLIQQSGNEVHAGSSLVAEASGKLKTMLGLVRESATSMETIARASSDQAAAIAGINTAVRQMDEMTQHNAALVEETNAAIEQTETRASDLDRLVATFRVGQPADADASANRGRDAGLRRAG